MTTELQTTISSALAHYSVTDAAIAELDSMFGGLTTNGPEDKKALKAVREARLNVRNIRLAVEATRKDLKADYLAVSQAIDGEARRIKALIDPIESRLVAEEAKVADELKRRADEEDRIKREALEVRLGLLARAGDQTPLSVVEAMTEGQFQVHLSAAKEAQAIALAERERAEAEAMRVAVEQREEAKRLAEESARIAVERQKVEAAAAEQARKDAAADAERRAKDAEARAQLDAERAAMEAEKTRRALEAQQEAEKRAEEAEAARVAAMGPLECVSEELEALAAEYRLPRLAALAETIRAISKEG